MKSYKYSEDSFTFLTSWNNAKYSEFDIDYMNEWSNKEENNLFRYKVDTSKLKILNGEFRMLAQLNEDRAVNRRIPQEFSSLSQPFSHELFNFTKMDKKEIMFKMNSDCGDYIAINVSPLTKYHSLLLPDMYGCHPQLATLASLRFALSILLLTASPGFRICFNSICGYASVNHLHFHLYYLNECMFLETALVELLAGRCYQIIGYPASGYVFMLSSVEQMDEAVSDVHKLLRYLVERNVAHNIFMTRAVKEGDSSSLDRDSVRIFVWARTSANAKMLDAFNVAACELFGHFVIKDLQTYETVTEDFLSKQLYETTHYQFEKTKPDVIQLFSDLKV